MSAEKILRGHDLFRSLGLEKTFEIKGYSSVKKYQAGEIIFGLNDYANHVYMLMNGSVDLQLPSQHHNYSLSITKIEKGELFGLSPLLGSERYTASAQCMEDSELLLIEAKPFQDVLNDNCIIGMSIMRKVAHIYFNRYMNVLKNLQEIAGQISLIQ